MGHSTPSTVAPTWPTMTITTSMASLSAPSRPAEHFKHTIHAHTASTQTAIQNVGNSPPHTCAALIHGTLRLVLRGGLGWHQTVGERISKIIRKKKWKIAEEDRKKKEEERALSSRSCAPDLLNDEPNVSLTNPPTPAQKERKDTRETKRTCDRLLPPKPIYVDSYEEHTPNLVNN